MALTSAKKDILRVHSDIALPQSSPNIGHLLYDYVEVRNRQVICTGEQMQIQGEADVNVLYSSPEGKTEHSRSAGYIARRKNMRWNRQKIMMAK